MTLSGRGWWNHRHFLIVGEGCNFLCNLWCLARSLVCPLRSCWFYTPSTESEWNPFLLALRDFRTLPVHLHKSQFLKNLKAHSFLIVQFTSLPFWLILNSLNCLCKDERLGFFFSPKGSDTVTVIIVNMITCHLVSLGHSLLICKMKKCYTMSLHNSGILCFPPTS